MKLTKQFLTQLSKLGLASTIGMAALISFGSQAAFGQKDLTIGSEAPELDIETWVSDRDGEFSHISEFESGKVYVVEFWATWCGPCIRSMPHIASLQDKYEDKDVQIISVSNEDLKTVEKFLKKKAKDIKDDDGESVTYGELTSGYCLTVDPDRSVANDYMKAASQTGIPCAFIVGKTGLIEWIGHPARMEEPLSEVVDGSWDREKFGTEFEDSIKEKKAFDKAMPKVADLASDLQFEAAIEELDTLIEELNPDGAMTRRVAGIRNSIAMKAGGDLAIETINKVSNSDQPMAVLPLVSSVIKRLRDEDDVHEDLVAAAIDATEKAAVYAEKEDDARAVGMLMHNQANLLYLSGKLDEAIAMQEKAVEKFDHQITQRFMKKLQDEKAEQNDTADDKDEDMDKPEDDEDAEDADSE